MKKITEPPVVLERSTMNVLRLSPDQTVRVQALARDIVLCFWARHLTLTVSLSTQGYKFVPAN